MGQDIVIDVSGIGKKYRLGATRHETLRDRLAHALSRFGSRSPAPQLRDYWALRDLSFSVRRGDVVGIIGRNGAGKSTLLKILSRITDPTTGRIGITGRVASLLEVGTGFHPELTGRENVFLNGALLGMGRSEIRAKFDEIVAFAEVDQFIDTAVKHYSSGMYVRLAFAVAAHLEPEILIVDEVLAVGDAAFQRKCLGKMREVARGHGRTVLFVSHQMTVVRQLCNVGLLLHKGQLSAHGPMSEVAGKYEGSFADAQQLRYTRPADKPKSAAWIDSIELAGETVEGVTQFKPRSPITLRIQCTLIRAVPAFQLAVRVSALGGQAVFTTTNGDGRCEIPRMEAGTYQMQVELPGLLAPGAYKLTIAALEPNREAFDLVEEALGFEVDRVGSLEGELRDNRQGLIEPVLTWNVQLLNHA